MLNLNPFKLAGAATLAAVALTVAVPAAIAAEGIVKVDGSSTVYPVTEAVAEEFQKEIGRASGRERV